MNKLVWEKDIKVSRSFDLNWYPHGAVEDARVAYQKYCKIEVNSLDDNRIGITFSALDSASESLSLIVLEFCNYLLDKTCEFQLNS